MTKERKAYMEAYRAVHCEKLREQDKAYKKAHREKYRGYEKRYQKTHREQINAKANAKGYYKSHPEECRVNKKKYRQTAKGKTTVKSFNARRRQLGFVPLNDWFDGSEGHHIDRERVVYIPKELHRSIWHNLVSGKNMEAINKVALSIYLLN